MTSHAGSWDQTMKAWDPRSNTSEVSSHDLNGKVYSMSLHANRLVIGTSERQIYIFDVRNLAQPTEVRESPLKHIIRCVKCHPDGSGALLIFSSASYARILMYALCEPCVISAFGRFDVKVKFGYILSS